MVSVISDTKMDYKPIYGIVRFIMRGDIVKKGQLLYVIDSKR